MKKQLAGLMLLVIAPALAVARDCDEETIDIVNNYHSDYSAEECWHSLTRDPDWAITNGDFLEGYDLYESRKKLTFDYYTDDHDRLAGYVICKPGFIEIRVCGPSGTYSERKDLIKMLGKSAFP